MTIKDMRRQYYRTQARPETHELHVSKSDSMAWLVEYHTKGFSCQYRPPLAVFVEEVTKGWRTDLYFKRILVKFFCEEPTQFVCKELV
jgi:hypothetical protein